MSAEAPAVDELMEARVTALFDHDHRGRTLATNEWAGRQPARFYLARTVLGSLCRIRADVPDQVALELQALAADEPPLGDRWDPPAHAAAYVRLLGTETRTFESGSELIYWFGADVAPSVPPVAIDETNAHLLRGGLEDWLPDVPHRQPMMAMIENGQAVSLCASVRITATSHEAGVETLPGYRRRGHAVNAVAGWAGAVRGRGIGMMFYSTSRENAASRAVAARLGLIPIGTDFSVS